MARTIHSGRATWRLGLASVLLLGIAACGDEDDSDASSVEESAAATDAAPESTASATVEESSVEESSATSVEESSEATVEETSPETTSAPGEEPIPGGILEYAISSDLAILGPERGSAFTTAFAPEIYGVYDALFGWDADMQEVIPRLAESLTSNEDNTVWTIKLREGLQFSDGTPLNAEAIKINWDRLAIPETSAVGGVRSWLEQWTYEAIDDTTFEVTMESPIGAFPAIVAGVLGGSSGNGLGVIASPAAIQQFGAEYGTTPESAIGAGPFTVKEWVKNDHMTLQRNPLYWDQPKPYVDEVVIRFVSDHAARANALIAGQLDVGWMYSPGAENKRLREAGLESYGEPLDSAVAVVFNQGAAPYDDVRVRRALMLATNTDDIVEKATLGEASAVHTWFDESSPFYNADIVQDYNLEEAQRLIDEYVAETGGPVQANLFVATGNQPAAEVVVQHWSSLENVEPNLTVMPGSELSPRTASGDFEAVLQANTIGQSFPESFYSQLHSEAAANVINYSNPELDALLVEARPAVSVEDRKTYLDQITRTILDDAVYVSIWRQYLPNVVGERVRGAQILTATSLDLTTMWLDGD